MTVVSLPIDPDSQYQISTVNLDLKGKILRVRVELRYLPKTDKWYFSLFNAQSGDPYCLYVPVVMSAEDVNNLLEQYDYKKIGFVACLNKAADYSAGDPAETNISGFDLVWGDEFVE